MDLYTLVSIEKNVADTAVYMKGFHRIRYERTTAVPEGAECCDYRLRFDWNKK